MEVNLTDYGKDDYISDGIDDADGYGEDGDDAHENNDEEEDCEHEGTLHDDILGNGHSVDKSLAIKDKMRV